MRRGIRASVLNTCIVQVGSLGTCIPYRTKKHLARRIPCCTGPGTKLHVPILTDGANLLFDLIGHGLMKVLELHTQSKVSQLDGAVG